MYVNFSPATMSLGELGFEETLRLGKAYGFEGIDLPAEAVSQMGNLEAVKEKVAEAGLRWGCFYLSGVFREGGDIEGALVELARHARTAETVGCRRCSCFVMPFHEELEYEANFTAHVERLRRACVVLGDHGIRLGIEFVGPRTMWAGKPFVFVHTCDEVIAMCDAIGLPSAGILLDTFHWYTSGMTVSDIREKLRGRVVLTHVNDGRAGRGPDEQIDGERALPGTTGVIDLKGFLSGLRDIGYDGPVAAEPKIARYRAIGEDAAVAEVAGVMRGLLARHA